MMTSAFAENDAPMESPGRATHVSPISKKALWAGRVLSILPALLLIMSGVMKLFQPANVLEEFDRLGYDRNVAVALGIVELVCTILYLVPRTAILGAILLTGYLGGATATHLRIGDPYIMPSVLGVILWLGLYLRDLRLRALIPLRSPQHVHETQITRENT